MVEEPTTRRPRKATGPDRPTYLDAGDLDKVMAALLALVSEVAAIRERLDTHERVAAEGLAPSPEVVETYAADPQTEAAREAWRDAYIRRIFRVLTEDLQPGRGTPPT
jgi:hypothetical protein